jgi:hypothetical protein
MEVKDEKEILITRLKESRVRVRQMIEAFGPDREVYPGWTMKHFMAHLTGWDEATTVSLRAHAKGNEPGTPAYRGIDHYNAESVATRVDLNYQQVLIECELAREDLIRAVLEMPDDKFQQEVLYPWGSTGSVSSLVKTMIHHDHEHSEGLEEVLHAQNAAQATEAPQTKAPDEKVAEEKAPEAILPDAPLPEIRTETKPNGQNGNQTEPKAENEADLRNVQGEIKPAPDNNPPS